MGGIPVSCPEHHTTTIYFKFAGFDFDSSVVGARIKICFNSDWVIKTANLKICSFATKFVFTVIVLGAEASTWSLCEFAKGKSYPFQTYSFHFIIIYWRREEKESPEHGVARCHIWNCAVTSSHIWNTTVLLTPVFGYL